MRPSPNKVSILAAGSWLAAWAESTHCLLRPGKTCTHLCWALGEFSTAAQPRKTTSIQPKVLSAWWGVLNFSVKRPLTILNLIMWRESSMHRPENLSFSPQKNKCVYSSLNKTEERQEIDMTCFHPLLNFKIYINIFRLHGGFWHFI